MYIYIYTYIHKLWQTLINYKLDREPPLLSPKQISFPCVGWGPFGSEVHQIHHNVSLKMAVSSHLKNIRRIGPVPQVGLNIKMLETTWNYQSDHDSPTFHQLLSSRLFWKSLFQSTGIFSCSSSLGSGRLLMPRSITIDTTRWCWWNVINTISKQIQIRWHFLNQTSFVATTHVVTLPKCVIWLSERKHWNLSG